jgi:hypothetical protein
MQAEVFGQFANVAGVGFNCIGRKTPLQQQKGFKTTNPGRPQEIFQLPQDFMKGK